MKLTLVKPNIGRMEHRLYIDEGRMEPLQLGVIAALTPPDVEVVLYDDRMEEVPYDEPTDLVGITVETFTARRAYEIADEYRRRHIPVVMGGMHAALATEEVAEHADSVYVGDAETRWVEMIEDLRRKKMKSTYFAGAGKPQPFTTTRRDLFKGKGYLPVTLMQFSRGCEYECSFCATSVYFKRTHNVREIREVIREIEEQGRKFVFFVDDNIVANPEAAKKLFREITPLKINWVSQASIDMTGDRELMNLMAKSGCIGHVVGFESIDRENLHLMNKAPNLGCFEGYGEPICIIRGYGLQIWAAFTLGHDFDTKDSIRRTLEFALKNRFAFAAFNILMPYPGTRFYEDLQEQNRLLYDGKWWLHPEYRFNHASFVPKNMTPDELTSECFEARRQFNSPMSILKRAFDIKTNMRTFRKLFLYAIYAPLFRKEVFKKQGMRFGTK